VHVPPAQLAQAVGERVALSPEQSHYLIDVLRLAPGDPLELFDGQGARWAAQLALDPQGRPELQLIKQADQPRDVDRVYLTLAQSLIKADKFELVIQKATELGCRRIIPLAAERSVVKLDEERGQSKVARWQKIAEEAARQCGRADIPSIEEPQVWNRLYTQASPMTKIRAVVLDPRAPLRLREAVQGESAVLLTVGPEGGFSDQELARAEENGFVRASLGPLILRAETAGLAALAVVQHLAGQLG
jgi:16S rRNA (uracil1498-N3)-methyltransferase